MYRQINLPPGQVNLDVSEAIATRSDQFSLMITEDIGIFSTEFLQSKTQEIVQISEDTCTILIVPPDKSILICFDHTERIMALFESHKHQGYGGLIAVGCYDDIRGFIMYIENMVAWDWQLSGGMLDFVTKTTFGHFVNKIPSCTMKETTSYHTQRLL